MAGENMPEVLIEEGIVSSDRESSGLAALHSIGILDTPVEPAYDAITRLAADYFEADSATIAFGDETASGSSRILEKPFASCRVPIPFLKWCWLRTRHW
jgi:hypothetical protein